MLNIRRYRSLRKNSIIGKVFRLPFKLIPKGFVIRVFRGPLAGMKWIKGAHNDSVWLGLYERNQTAEFLRCAKVASCFLDLGAHVGYYSLLFARANPQGKGYAFEPSAVNYPLLCQHIRINSITNILVYNLAVSDTEGSIKFTAGKTSVASRLAINGELVVNSIKLSNWVASEKIPVPDLIKMDIEGAELSVLSDLLNLLKEYHPPIFLSTHGDATHQSCIQLLRAAGYRINPIDHKELEHSKEIFAFL